MLYYLIPSLFQFLSFSILPSNLLAPHVCSSTPSIVPVLSSWQHIHNTPLDSHPFFFVPTTHPCYTIAIPWTSQQQPTVHMQHNSKTLLTPHVIAEGQRIGWMLEKCGWTKNEKKECGCVYAYVLCGFPSRKNYNCHCYQQPNTQKIVKHREARRG